MAEIIRMPKMSDTMEEGVIASWLKKVGDTVKPGDILAEVETDKATMELESYEEGVLLYIGVQEKDSVPVNGIIAIIGEKGEDFQLLLNGSAPAPAKAQDHASCLQQHKCHVAGQGLIPQGICCCRGARSFPAASPPLGQ